MENLHSNLAPPSRTLPDCASYRLGDYFSACARREPPMSGCLTKKQPFDRGDGLLVHYGDDGDLGSQEVVRFDSGFGLISSYFNVADHYVGRSVGENWLTLQFRLNGTSTELFGDKGQTTALDSHCHVVVLPDGVDKACWIDKGVQWRTVVLALHLDRTRQIMTDISAGLPSAFGDILRNPQASEFYFKSVPLTQSMLRAVLDLTHSPYTGKTRMIYAQAKAMELMCLTFETLKRDHGSQNASPPVVLNSRDVSRLFDAKERLTNDLGSPISNKQLARLVGLNETKLTRGFREVFGLTLFNYYQQCRMRQAHTLLAQDGRSVDETAHRLGYAHVSSFSKAFRRFYGLSPRGHQNMRLK